MTRSPESVTRRTTQACTHWHPKCSSCGCLGSRRGTNCSKWPASRLSQQGLLLALSETAYFAGWVMHLKELGISYGNFFANWSRNISSGQHR